MEPLTPSQTADLERRWAEPHRRHHDVRHLREVLAALDALAADGTPFDADATGLAAWFHDCVYDVAAADNEAQSAQVARDVLGATPLSDEVARLVLMTVTHQAEPGDRNAAALSDADLSVLGSTPARYREYSAAVREEFAVVPAEYYRPARAKILDEFLRREPIFHTAAGRARWEAQARVNIAAEIADLQAPTD